jgi:hypothetical protein
VLGADSRRAALGRPHRPLRQPMPLLRREPGNENKSARGAYVFQEAEGGGGGIVDANRPV